jgi:hypothetical protein
MVFDARKIHYNDYLPIDSSMNSTTPSLPNDVMNANMNESQPSITLCTSMSNDQVIIPNEKKLSSSKNTTFEYPCNCYSGESKDSSVNRSTTNKEQENKYGCEDSSASETRKEHQGSKNTSEDNAGSEDAIANENATN